MNSKLNLIVRHDKALDCQNVKGHFGDAPHFFTFRISYLTVTVYLRAIEPSLTQIQGDKSEFNVMTSQFKPTLGTDWSLMTINCR